MTKQIPLTQGRFALVDDDDFEIVKDRKWRAWRRRKTFYAVHSEYQTDTYIYKSNRRQFKSRMILMHRFILGLDGTSKPFVDHINHDGLDNRRCNLRLATNSQNTQNRQILANNKSGYKGVVFEKRKTRTGRWIATISSEGKQVRIGMFDTPREAAYAYDAKARQLHGDFAFCNFNDATQNL